MFTEPQWTHAFGLRHCLQEAPVELSTNCQEYYLPGEGWGQAHYKDGKEKAWALVLRLVCGPLPGWLYSNHLGSFHPMRFQWNFVNRCKKPPGDWPSPGFNTRGRDADEVWLGVGGWAAWRRTGRALGGKNFCSSGRSQCWGVLPPFVRCLLLPVVGRASTNTSNALHFWVLSAQMTCDRVSWMERWMNEVVLVRGPQNKQSLSFSLFHTVANTSCWCI